MSLALLLIFVDIVPLKLRWHHTKLTNVNQIHYIIALRAVELSDDFDLFPGFNRMKISRSMKWCTN
jgi:hypothetical protein